MIKIYSLTGDVKHDILVHHSELVRELEAEEYNNWNIQFAENVQVLSYKDRISLFIRDDGKCQIIDAIDIDLHSFAHLKVW